MAALRRNEPVLRALFPSKARRAVVEALFSGHPSQASVSELARRAGLTPRAVSVEVEKLEAVGLVSVEAEGAAHVVKANRAHPVAKALAHLVRAARTPGTKSQPSDPDLRPSLAAYGAPLMSDAPRPALPLADAVLRGLRAARTDATLLRVLPVVVAKNALRFDWPDLRERARRMNLKAELGMLLELTGHAGGLPEVEAQAAALRDGRRRRTRFFSTVANRYDEKLAEMRTPPSAARWGFRMNMTEESVRDMLRKHAS